MNRKVVPILFALGSLACAEAPTSAPLRGADGDAAAAKQPPNPTTTWEVFGTLSDGVTPAGITGDGRDASGLNPAMGATGT